MATVNFSTNSNAKYAQYLNKKFLTTALESLVLADYAVKNQLPKEAGTLTMRLFKRSKASASTVTQVTTEGQSVTYNNSTITNVDVPLNQFYDASQITRRANVTEIFSNIDNETNRQSEAAANWVETQLRNAIVAAPGSGGAQAGNRIYAQGAASFSALNTAGYTTGKFTCADIRRLVTVLKKNLTPKVSISTPDAKMSWKGYIVVVSPDMNDSLQQDPDWKLLAQHSVPALMQKGEIGMIYGAKVIETTLPFIEDGAGTENTYVASPSANHIVHTALAFGQEGFGCADLASYTSPLAPKVTVLDKADKSDPINQYIAVVWDAYFGQAVLDPSWVAICKAIVG